MARREFWWAWDTEAWDYDQMMTAETAVALLRAWRRLPGYVVTRTGRHAYQVQWRNGELVGRMRWRRYHRGRVSDPVRAATV